MDKTAMCPVLESLDGAVIDAAGTAVRSSQPLTRPPHSSRCPDLARAVRSGACQFAVTFGGVRVPRTTGPMSRTSGRRPGGNAKTSPTLAERCRPRLVALLPSRKRRGPGAVVRCAAAGGRRPTLSGRPMAPPSRIYRSVQSRLCPGPRQSLRSHKQQCAWPIAFHR